MCSHHRVFTIQVFEFILNSTFISCKCLRSHTNIEHIKTCIKMHSSILLPNGNIGQFFDKQFINDGKVICRIADRISKVTFNFNVYHNISTEFCQISDIIPKVTKYISKVYYNTWFT